MRDEHDHAHDDENGGCCQGGPGLPADIESMFDMDQQSQIFLEIRGQNIELLKVATQIAGYSNPHGPLKPGEMRQAVKTIYDLFADLYALVDPQEEELDEEDELEDEE
jgi:hypothetical protein